MGDFTWQMFEKEILIGEKMMDIISDYSDHVNCLAQLILSLNISMRSVKGNSLLEECLRESFYNIQFLFHRN